MSEFCRKIDFQKRSPYMKQNGGNFFISIFLKNSFTNYWFLEWGIEVGLLKCIFLIKNNPICPCQRNDPKSHGFCIIFVVFAKDKTLSSLYFFFRETDVIFVMSEFRPVSLRIDLSSEIAMRYFNEKEITKIHSLNSTNGSNDSIHSCRYIFTSYNILVFSKRKK